MEKNGNWCQSIDSFNMKRQPGTTRRKTGSGRSRTHSFFLLLALFPLRWGGRCEFFLTTALDFVCHPSSIPLLFLTAFPLVVFHFICLFLANVFTVGRSVQRMKKDLGIKAFKRIRITRRNAKLMKEYLRPINLFK